MLIPLPLLFLPSPSASISTLLVYTTFLFKVTFCGLQGDMLIDLEKIRTNPKSDLTSVFFNCWRLFSRFFAASNFSIFFTLFEYFLFKPCFSLQSQNGCSNEFTGGRCLNLGTRIPTLKIRWLLQTFSFQFFNLFFLILFKLSSWFQFFQIGFEFGFEISFTI